MEKKLFVGSIFAVLLVFYLISFIHYEVAAKTLEPAPAPVEEQHPQRGLTTIEGPSPDAPICYVGENEGFIVVLVKKDGNSTTKLTEVLSSYGRVIMDPNLQLPSTP